MAARDLVFRAGDRVRTFGRFVSGADGDWLDVQRVHDLMIKPPGWKSDLSIRLIGADAAAVPSEFGPNQVPGHIKVVGRWHAPAPGVQVRLGDESIEVETQTPEGRRPRPRADRTRPPCPPPSGGWPQNVTWHEGWPHSPVSHLDLDIRDLESSGAIVHRVIFRPSEDQEVLVVAATDVEAVTRALSPSLPNQLCVVQSRFTRAQLDEVGDVLHAHFQEWRLESFGTGNSDAQGQPFARAEPVRVTPELAAWADTLPHGVLLLDPTITPA
ncbi:hypothetical protein GCM10009630_29340 [Kribbella jejuensis]|uniref:Uncharacterized protein n=1 Tax=Kribbella jejuensis TaxID=236068 RepID=A0A542EQG6_9ACTN|nr:hypothetical protein FB475_1554 [Kribbella jejuensis]